MKKLLDQSNEGRLQEKHHTTLGLLVSIFIEQISATLQNSPLRQAGFFVSKVQLTHAFRHEITHHFKRLEVTLAQNRVRWQEKKHPQTKCSP